MTIDQLETASLYILVTVGTIALAVLLAAFIVFVFRVTKALKLTKPRAKCPRCDASLPAIPSTAVVKDEGTSFLFTCSSCGHKIAVKAEEVG